MKVKTLIAAFAVATAGIGAMALVVTRPATQTLADPVPSYTCGYVNFGMKYNNTSGVEETNFGKAMTYEVTNGTANLSGYYTATTGLVNKIECDTYVESGKTKYLVFGDSATPSGYSQYIIKIGGSKKKGSFKITFNSNIIGCTVYALGYKNKDNNVVDVTTMVVNTQETTLANSAMSYTKANAVAVKYDAYSFTFADPTNELTIGSKENSKTVDGKSVSAARFFVAHIAVRVAA